MTSGKILIMAIGYFCKVKGVRPFPSLSEEHSEFRRITRSGILKLDFGNDGGFHKALISHLILRCA